MSKEGHLNIGFEHDNGKEWVYPHTIEIKSHLQQNEATK